MGETMVNDEKDSDVVSSNKSRRPIGRKMANEELQKKKSRYKKIKLASISVAAEVKRDVALKRR